MVDAADGVLDGRPHMDDQRMLALTANIVAAHVAHNKIGQDAIPTLIRDVHSALMTLGNQPKATTEEPPIPAVPIKKSVFPDYIICLEDGKKLKMLKRHLATSYDMTPDEYRKKWNLSVGYPMVAPNYAMKRSSLAKKIGLGTTTRPASPEEQETPLAEQQPETEHQADQPKKLKKNA